jgi:hypothetical protein
VLRNTTTVEGPGGEAESVIDYYDFGEPVNAPVPPEHQTVEVEELGFMNPFEDL